MGCGFKKMGPQDTKDCHVQKAHADHIETFDYTHGCSDWEEHLHLHLVLIIFFSQFHPFNSRANDNLQ